MIEPPSPACCRLSFSLRTLFAAVTVTAFGLGWAGYQLNWIRRRHALFDGPIPTDQVYFSYGYVTAVENGDTLAPWQLRLFGEPGCPRIYAAYHEDDPRMGEIRVLFPEAEVTSDLGLVDEPAATQ